MNKTTAILLCLASGAAGLAGGPYLTPVVVPHYSAAYSPSNVDQQLAAIAAEVKAARADIAKLLKIAEEVHANPPADKPDEAADPNAPKPPKDLVGAANICNGCHSQADAETKGGDFKLFDARGAFAKISTRKAKAAADMVRNGTMPPAGAPKLTAEQKTAILAQLDAMGATLPPP